ncbi:hypothetical protein COOONC_01131, partial [Cooperia oncophora]
LSFKRFAAIPYSIYLVTNWNPTFIDLNPYYIAILGAPAIFFSKVHLVLTISAAFERTLASFLPMYYRRLSLSTYAIITLLVSLILAAFDPFVVFTLITFERKPGCAALGCFIERSNSLAAYYWETNTLVSGARSLALFKVYMIIPNLDIQSYSRLSNSFANRICAGILLTSLAFVTSPCVIMNIVNIWGFSIYSYVGPFFFAFLLCNGTFTNVVHLMLNRSMRKQAKTFFTVGRFAAMESVAPKERFTAAGSRTSMPHIS